MAAKIPAMRLRPPTRDDAEAVLAVIVARDIADIGHPDFTLDDLVEEWSAPDMELERDAFVAEDDDGRIVGYASVDKRATMVLVDPEHEGRGIGTALREAAEARALERGEEIRQPIAAGNAVGIEHLRAAGYEPEHVYLRLNADLEDVPHPAGDLAIRRFDLETEGREIHELIEAAFTEIPGNVPESYERFHLSVDSRSEPPFRLAADLDGRLAGVATGQRWENGAGYVAILATASGARGRGVGRELLLAMLDAFRREGLTRAELSVHGTNAPATGLYESVGMKPGWRSERWVKRS
jgi:ribosomal protein S18 acetylase RimI-like enzyme